MASTTPSSGEVPVATKPSPSSPIPWWWCDLTAPRSVPVDPGGQRARLERHLVVAELPRRVSMAVAPDHVRQVLLQRPPAGHVEYLHAPAGAEDGDAPVDRPRRQGDLEAVALGPREPGLRVRRGAVTGGVDVRSARQQEAVDPIEQEVG